MDLQTLSPEIIRVIIAYLVQAILGGVLAGLFYYFRHLYNRKYLLTWTWSWLFFVVFMIANMVITIMLGFQNPNRFIPSLVAQIFSFFQTIFLVAGTYELVRDRLLPSQRFYLALAGAVILAVVSVSAYDGVAGATTERYALRFGLRTIIAAIGLTACSILLLQRRRKHNNGQFFLAGTFGVYSILHYAYVVVVVGNLFGSTFRFPDYFGFVDIFMLALIGISQVMWLLEDEREKLRVTNLELDNFLYSTSHDLRAPIASILGLTYLGKVELKEDLAREYMGMIEERIRKLDEVIRDILNLQKAKKLALKIEQFDFNNLMRETISDLKFNEGAPAITLRYEWKENLLKSDYNQMKIILLNLIGNAVKYHNLKQEDPFIEVVFTRLSANKVMITVADNGEGIPEKSLPKIFDMFYRASTNSQGTGLGLYLVKESLAKLRGSISVESRVGHGSTFTILLEKS